MRVTKRNKRTVKKQQSKLKHMVATFQLTGIKISIYLRVVSSTGISTGIHRESQHASVFQMRPHFHLFCFVISRKQLKQIKQTCHTVDGRIPRNCTVDDTTKLNKRNAQFRTHQTVRHWNRHIRTVPESQWNWIRNSKTPHKTIDEMNK